MDYLDAVFDLSENLPKPERYNLVSQMRRAATSIALNIAEGSTGQSDAEQRRFLGHALRSYLETIACLDIIERRKYVSEQDVLPLRKNGHKLFIKLIAFRKSLE